MLETSLQNSTNLGAFHFAKIFSWKSLRFAYNSKLAISLPDSINQSVTQSVRWWYIRQNNECCTKPLICAVVDNLNKDSEKQIIFTLFRWHKNLKGRKLFWDYSLLRWWYPCSLKIRAFRSHFKWLNRYFGKMKYSRDSSLKIKPLQMINIVGSGGKWILTNLINLESSVWPVM